MSDLEEGTTRAPSALSIQTRALDRSAARRETLVSQLYPQPEKVDYKKLPVLLTRLKGLPISSGLPVYSLFPTTVHKDGEPGSIN